MEWSLRVHKRHLSILLKHGTNYGLREKKKKKKLPPKISVVLSVSLSALCNHVPCRHVIMFSMTPSLCCSLSPVEWTGIGQTVSHGLFFSEPEMKSALPAFRHKHKSVWPTFP